MTVSQSLYTSEESKMEDNDSSYEIQDEPATGIFVDATDDDEVTDDTTEEVKEIEEAVATQPRKHKVKYNGIEEEATEEELIANYQAMKASQQRFNDAAKLKQDADVAQKRSMEFIRLLKTDPKRVLSDPAIGVDMLAFARDLLAEQLEEEMLSPEEKEYKQTKRKLDEYERAENERIEQAKTVEMKQYEKMYEDEYSASFVDAIKTVGLPATPSVIASMAQHMMIAIDKGHDVSAVDIAKYLKQEQINQTLALFGGADEDTLAALLGDSLSSKVTKGYVNKMKKSKMTPITQPTVPSDSSSQPRESKKMSRDEWYDMINKK